MRARRGLTLLETLLSMSLLAVMMAAVVLCERTMRAAQPKSAAQSDVDRKALVAFEKLRTQLKGALVLPPTQEGVLAYYAPEREANGDLKLGPTGEPLYPATASVLQADAQLGEHGWLRFQLQPELHLLRVTIHAETSCVREIRAQIALPNQN